VAGRATFSILDFRFRAGGEWPWAVAVQSKIPKSEIENAVLAGRATFSILDFRFSISRRRRMALGRCRSIENPKIGNRKCRPGGSGDIFDFGFSIFDFAPEANGPGPLPFNRKSQNRKSKMPSWPRPPVRRRLRRHTVKPQAARLAA
jgi:hypothetical protein